MHERCALICGAAGWLYFVNSVMQILSDTDVAHTHDTRYSHRSPLATTQFGSSLPGAALSPPTARTHSNHTIAALLLAPRQVGRQLSHSLCPAHSPSAPFGASTARTASTSSESIPAMAAASSPLRSAIVVTTSLVCASSAAGAVAVAPASRAWLRKLVRALFRGVSPSPLLESQSALDPRRRRRAASARPDALGLFLPS